METLFKAPLIDFKLSDDPKIALQRYGQHLYDGLILFSPTTERFGGSLDMAAILDFVDTIFQFGHHILMLQGTRDYEIVLTFLKIERGKRKKNGNRRNASKILRWLIPLKLIKILNFSNIRGFQRWTLIKVNAAFLTSNHIQNVKTIIPSNSLRSVYIKTDSTKKETITKASSNIITPKPVPRSMRIRRPLKPVAGQEIFCKRYGDTCTFFFEGIAKRIAASGYGVYAIDHPGFGLSEGLHGRPEVRGLPRFLLGQSMGGAIALKVHLKEQHCRGNEAARTTAENSNLFAKIYAKSKQD
ncbi:hypothetical protein L1887_17893 [Cichorium endivia]|nr:hypothetical protein L1887_17893 [Cichorium endivia]